MAEHTEIQCNGSADEDKEEEEELALLLEVGGAGLEDDVADFEHRRVGLEFAHFVELPEAEEEAENHDGEAPIEDGGVGIGGETCRHFEVCFTGESHNWRCQSKER